MSDTVYEDAMRAMYDLLERMRAFNRWLFDMIGSSPSEEER